MAIRNENTTSYTHPDEPNLVNLHKAMDYNAAGQPIVRVAGSEIFGNMNIALGNVPGMTQVFKHGFNSSFANATEESFWDGSVIYPWSAWNSTGTLSVVSSGADTGELTIYGLDTDYNIQQETITLTGTSPVTTDNTWARVHEMSYTDGTPNVGTITATRGATVISQINIGFGRSQQAQYTVPAGHTAFLFSGQANIGKGQDGQGRFKYRLFGQTFQVAIVFLLYESVFEKTFTTPFVLPEKTDLDVTLIANNNGTAASCNYDLILVDNSLLPS